MIRILDDESMEPVLESFAPMRIDVMDEKKATRFQVESGSVRSDHVIENPVEIMVDIILTDDDAQSQFDELTRYYSENKLVSVQCNFGTYTSMLIESIPHVEQSAIYKGAALPVRLVEWREVEPEYGALKQEQVANPEHTSTADRGKQPSRNSGTDTESAKKRGSSILSRWYNG